MYPLLRRLEGQGVLMSEWETSGAKPRKYYVLTPEGKELYETLKKYWNESLRVWMFNGGETTMQNELIERYIYAVTKRLPYKMRADIEKELRALIDDMLEQRCGDVLPSEHDIRVVLTKSARPRSLRKNTIPISTARSSVSPTTGNTSSCLNCARGGGRRHASFRGDYDDIGRRHGKSVFPAGILDRYDVYGLIYAFAFVTALFAFFERRV